MRLVVWALAGQLPWRERFPFGRRSLLGDVPWWWWWCLLAAPPCDATCTTLHSGAGGSGAKILGRQLGWHPGIGAGSRRLWDSLRRWGQAVALPLASCPDLRSGPCSLPACRGRIHAARSLAASLSSFVVSAALLLRDQVGSRGGGNLGRRGAGWGGGSAGCQPKLLCGLRCAAALGPDEGTSWEAALAGEWAGP